MQSLILAVASRPASVSVSDFCIITAPTVSEMHAVLGKPSRIDSGEIPAPTGHRNSQKHVYDETGVTFNEHHYTFLVTEVACWFNMHDPEYRFTPKSNFKGKLLLDGIEMPLGADVREFLSVAPYEFAGGFGGSWHYRFDGFCVFVCSRGDRLPSGGRSKVRKVVSVHLSWPHDNWQKPERPA